MPGCYVQVCFPDLELKRCSENVKASMPGSVENPVDMLGRRARIPDDRFFGLVTGEIAKVQAGTDLRCTVQPNTLRVHALVAQRQVPEEHADRKSGKKKKSAQFP